MQTDLFGTSAITRRSAQAAREHGAAMADRAEERNERTNPGWTQVAVERVRAFAGAQSGVFTIEMMRSVLERELPPPTDGRIWGKVTVLARRAQYIEPVRGAFFAAASSNGSPKQVYRRGSKA